MRTNERARTDTELMDDVRDALRGEPSLDEPELGVVVRSGIVTITGAVGTWAEKSAAERAARRVYGVQGVADQIEVRIPAGDACADVDLVKAAKAALQWHVHVPRDQVTVSANGGWIALRGQVDRQYQREAAEDAVSHLRGVKGVLNEITLPSRAVPADVTKRIVMILGRNAALDASRINVDAKDGRVILSGRVRSWAERKEAELAARAAGGEVEIQNDLHVA